MYCSIIPCCVLDILYNNQGYRLHIPSKRKCGNIVKTSLNPATTDQTLDRSGLYRSTDRRFTIGTRMYDTRLFHSSAILDNALRACCQDQIPLHDIIIKNLPVLGFYRYANQPKRHNVWSKDQTQATIYKLPQTVI